MRSSLSRFVQDSARIGSNLEEKIMIDIYLAILERHLAKYVQHSLRDLMGSIDGTLRDLMGSIDGKPASLQQFKNVVLRYEEPKKWKAFLDGVTIRKGELEWVKKIQGWFEDNSNSPVNQCLEKVKTDIYRMYYSLDELDEYPENRPNTNLPHDEWNVLVDSLENTMKENVMREFLLRVTEFLLRVTERA
ncbi:hypothetical protein GF312_01930 [Candidatus Poribacteria bacterium]|nr:hypothetical protein [Candidatus Poribacteria bacterium]